VSANGTAEALWQANCYYKNGRQFLYSRGVGWLWWVAHESFHGDRVQPTLFLKRLRGVAIFLLCTQRTAARHGFPLLPISGSAGPRCQG
jgi:hypothetical protein